MKYAIISDIHSNLEALQTTLEHIKNEKVDKVVCLGDIVGYGPNPKECINLIKSIAGAEVLLGNHDAGIINKTDINEFNEYAKQAIEINKGLLSEEEEKYLSTLKEKHSETGILFVHGSPRDSLNEYLSTMKKLQENMDLFSERICFVGHTHLPLVYVKTDLGTDYVENVENNQEIDILDDRRYIVNAGSVGQPRDEDNRVCFLYYDTDEKKITYQRLKYDIESVKKRMKSIGLPGYLINRLNVGK